MQQVRVETDPSDRTQMRLTVASEEPNTTYEYSSDLILHLCLSHCMTPLLDERCTKCSRETFLVYLNAS